MVPRPKEVRALDNYQLKIRFDSGETKIYDMSSLLDLPFYRRLRNKDLFKTVKVKDITLEWATGEDICPDELYNNSKKA